MHVLLRRWVEWKARKNAAQVIIYDGAAEYEKTRSLIIGMVVGALGMSFVFALMAPTAIDPQLLEAVERRQMLADEATQRADQAVEIAQLCLKTASSMDRTLNDYKHMLGVHK